MLGVSALQAAADPKRLEALQMGSVLLAKDLLLPVREPLGSLFPLGGLQRGSVTVIGPSAPGATSLALELLAGASEEGHFCAAVGLPGLGLVAAAERGIALDRLLLVPRPGPSPRWQQVLAALFEAVPLVLFSPDGSIRTGESRKVAARAKKKGVALLVLDKKGHWQEPVDLSCRVTGSSWSGLGQGHGLLRERNLVVELSGRGAAAKTRQGAACF
jgi:hypothetical protein